MLRTDWLDFFTRCHWEQLPRTMFVPLHIFFSRLILLNFGSPEYKDWGIEGSSILLKRRNVSFTPPRVRPSLGNFW